MVVCSRLPFTQAEDDALAEAVQHTIVTRAAEAIRGTAVSIIHEADQSIAMPSLHRPPLYSEASPPMVHRNSWHAVSSFMAAAAARTIDLDFRRSSASTCTSRTDPQGLQPYGPGDADAATK